MKGAAIGGEGCRRRDRRAFLGVSSLGLASWSLPDVLRARASAAGGATKDTAVIQIWLGGAASHLETYDPKPDAPAEFRGPFGVLATKVPGVRLCETLPRHAHLMDRVVLLRSVHHTNNDHQHAMHWCLTGHSPLGNAFARSSHPSTGSVAARVRGVARPGILPYVCVGYPLDDVSSSRMLPHRAAHWGKRYDPFEILNQRLGNGKEPWLERDFRVQDLDPAAGLTGETLAGRRALLWRIDRLRRQAEATRTLDGGDCFQQEAFELLTGQRVREAFDLDRESSRVRQRYGPSRSGQTALLARRLVEAGVCFVTVIDPGVGLSSSGWDLHTRLEWGMKTACPPMDRAVTALIEDLQERGLHCRVLVLVWGEFGRTPRINKDAGRDHWSGVQSVLLAGGNFRMGQVIGSSTRNGEVPRDRPLGPEDVVATLYHHLGIPPRLSFPDPVGRPVPVLDSGEVIRELL